jgi:hypothetical protein
MHTGYAKPAKGAINASGLIQTHDTIKSQTAFINFWSELSIVLLILVIDIQLHFLSEKLHILFYLFLRLIAS